MTPAEPATYHLPLTEPAPSPRELATHPEALRAAFKRSTLWHPPLRMTFEQAIADPAVRICLTTAAEIRARRQLERTA